MRGEAWDAAIGETIAYRDEHGDLSLPLPTLVGLHQAENAALAVAMLRHQREVHVTPEAMARGIRDARWPARLQRLGKGPLTELASNGHSPRDVWLDGGHNPDAGLAIARHFTGHAPLHLVLGMLANKDPAALLGRWHPRCSAFRWCPRRAMTRIVPRISRAIPTCPSPPSPMWRRRLPRCHPRAMC
jgi:dihydrofolate synthase/folylpolyglutamate synthase